MTFQWPQLLWLLALPLLLAIVDLARRARVAAVEHPKILRAKAGSRMLQLETNSATNNQAAPRPARIGKLRICLWLGLALAVIACARPQWGRIEEPVFDQSREILIALDLSRSMLSPDVKPSRLERARLLVSSLLEKLKGERVGLIVFSGTAFLQSPLSSDYEILREFLPVLTPGYLPEGGTNYHALLDTALKSFSTSESADRFLIILSDGEATDDKWQPLADDLKKKNIRVISLGIGTEAGSMMPDGSGGYIKDERGAVVLSKLESSTLRELASKTDGIYADASGWVDLAQLVDNTVSKGRRGEFREENRVRLAERYQWALAPALLLLALSFWFEFPVRPKNRNIRLAAPKSRTTPANSTP